MRNRIFKHIGIGVLILGILFLALWIRIQSIDNLPTEQFTENDAYLYYWQAQIIVDRGYLPERDMHRWLPFGRDNRQLFPLYSYTIAYTHKLLPWLPLYQIQLYLPTLCFVLGFGVFLLFFVQNYGITFTSIVGILLAILPGCIERSAAGFGDRDAWCWLFGALAVISYLWKEQMQLGTRRYVITALSGLTVFLGGFSWEGFGFFLLIILAVEHWKFCTTEAEHHLKEYLIWILMFVPWLYLISPAYRSGYGFSTHVSTLMIVSPLALLIMQGLRGLLLRYIAILQQHARKLAFVGTLLCIIIGLCYIFLQMDTFEMTAFPFRESRLMQSVGELRNPEFYYWTSRYGGIFVLGSIGLIGATLQLWKRNARPLTLSLILFVVTTFFREPLNGWIGVDKCDRLFIASVVLTGLGLAAVCLREKTENKDELIVLSMLAWFLLWCGLAREGKRYDFFTGIPLAYGTAWCLWIAPVYLIQQLKKVRIIYPHVKERRFAICITVVVLVTFLVWTPLSGHTLRVNYATTKVRPPIPGEGSILQTFEWMKATLPESTVVATDWSYGSQINVLGRVKTITDQDHFMPHWVHLYYRHVFCAQSEIEALTFLKTHGATHLMLTELSLTDHAKGYSLMGSNENADRQFQCYPLSRIETAIDAPYRIAPQQEDIPLTFVDIDRKTSKELSVSAHFNNGKKIDNIVSWNADKTMLKTVDIGNSGLVFYFSPNAKLQKAYVIPPSGWNSFAVKLFFRGEHIETFVPIYPTDKDNIAEVKVWKINYPQHIKANPKYLATEPEALHE